MWRFRHWVPASDIGPGIDTGVRRQRLGIGHRQRGPATGSGLFLLASSGSAVHGFAPRLRETFGKLSDGFRQRLLPDKKKFSPPLPKVGLPCPHSILTTPPHPSSSKKRWPLLADGHLSQVELPGLIVFRICRELIWRLRESSIYRPKIPVVCGNIQYNNTTIK